MPFFEEKTYRFIYSVIEPGDVFIDVGAHIGDYTIPIARAVGPQGTVIAVEPSPISEYLRKNVELNELKNVIVVSKAAYSRKYTLGFWYEPLRSGQASISDKHNIFEVEAEPLDEIVRKYHCRLNNLKLLKVDVEGAEVEVFKGAQEILSKVSYVVFEADPKRTLKACLSILKYHNFKAQLLEPFPSHIRNNYVAIKQ